MTSDLRDQFFAFDNRRSKFLGSLSLQAAQVKLDEGQKLECAVVKLLRNAHPFGSANGDEILQCAIIVGLPENTGAGTEAPPILPDCTPALSTIDRPPGLSSSYGGSDRKSFI